MITSIRTKIRALIDDLTKSDFETFTYSSGDKIFPMAEANIVEITEVLKNGVELGTGDYSYSATTGKITIAVTLVADDIIEVDYTFNKYSDTELSEYVRASLVWLSVFADCETDYELEDDEIVPTPDNKTIDLIALISAILIKPDYTEYRLPNLTVRYEGKELKEKRIEKLIMRFRRGLGITAVLEF